MAIKMKVFRDYELESSGVTPIWTFTCTSDDCWLNQIGGHYTLFWENAIKAAIGHLKGSNHASLI